METQTTATKPSSSSAALLFKIAAVVLLFVITLQLYAFTHELGHALVGLALGGQLTSFSVSFWDLSAHAAVRGDFPAAQSSLIAVAGVTLPLVLWNLFLLRIPKKTNLVLEGFKLIGSMGVINALLAWIVIPFLYLSGKAPADDSTNFMRASGVPPLLVSALAALVYIYCWVLLLNRCEGWRGVVARLRAGLKDPLDAGSRPALARLLACGLAVALVSVVISLFYPFASPLLPPQGYTRAFDLDLSSRGYAGETVYSFILDQPADVSFFFGLKDFTRGPVSITLVGPDGYSNTFMRSEEEFTARAATLNPRRVPLGSGVYAVQVTFPRMPALATGYLQISPPEIP